MKPSADVAGVGDVLGVLDPDDPEVGLLPGRAEDLAGREELAPVQPAGQVEDAGALHDGVVDVEERGRRRVGRRAERVLDLGGGRGGLAGERPNAAAGSGRRVAGHVPAAGHAIGRRGDASPRPSLLAPGASTGAEASPGCDACEARPCSAADVAALVAARGRRTPGRGRAGRGGRAARHVGRAGGPGRPGRDRLGAAGVVAGQRVLVALGNRIEFVTAYLGTLRAQAGAPSP